MNAKQYKAALEKLELNQLSGARFIGIAARTSQNYAGGQRRVPKTVARFLHLAIALKLPAAEIVALYGKD